MICGGLDPLRKDVERIVPSASSSLLFQSLLAKPIVNPPLFLISQHLVRFNQPY